MSECEEDEDQILSRPGISNSTIRSIVFTPKLVSLQKAGIEKTNVRYKFIGEGLLNNVVSRLIYLSSDTYNEAELNFIKEYVLAPKNLVKICDSYVDGLEEEFLDEIDDTNRKRIAIDLFKAYIGGVYVDNSYNESEVFKWLKRIINPKIEEAKRNVLIQQVQVNGSIFTEGSGNTSTEELMKSAKNDLYQLLFKGGYKVEYIVLSKVGPIERPVFEMGCLVNDRLVSRGSGPNKKTASGQAAFNVLSELGLLNKLVTSEHLIQERVDALLEDSMLYITE